MTQILVHFFYKNDIIDKTDVQCLAIKNDCCDIIKPIKKINNKNQLQHKENTIVIKDFMGFEIGCSIGESNDNITEFEYLTSYLSNKEILEKDLDKLMSIVNEKKSLSKEITFIVVYECDEFSDWELIGTFDEIFVTK